MVFPSCNADGKWLPVDELVYVGAEWDQDKTIDDCSAIVDVIVWVGSVDPKQDWLELSNSHNVTMLTVSDTIQDWTSSSTNINLKSAAEKLLQKP